MCGIVTSNVIKHAHVRTVYIRMYSMYSVRTCVCTVHTVCIRVYVQYVQCAYMCMYSTYSERTCVCTVRTVCIHVYVQYVQ